MKLVETDEITHIQVNVAENDLPDESKLNPTSSIRWNADRGNDIEEMENGFKLEFKVDGVAHGGPDIATKIKFMRQATLCHIAPNYLICSILQIKLRKLK